MNPLLIGFWVLVGLLMVVWAFGSVIYPVILLTDHNDGDPWPWRRVALSIVSLVVSITVGIVIIGANAPDDGYEHCGVGTHYVVLQDGKYSTWECVAG